MVMTAAQASTLTRNANEIQNQTNLQNEIGLVEQRIRTAASLNHYAIIYSATLIGNPPPGDMNSEGSDLEGVQQDFYDTMTAAGYVVTYDPAGWAIRWEETGAEQLVRVYRIRTSLTPGGVRSQTIAAIDGFFAGMSPKALSRTTVINDVDESEFGTPDSVFYEYITAVDQPSSAADYRSELREMLLDSGLGYSDHSGGEGGEGGVPNVRVYKLL